MQRNAVVNLLSGAWEWSEVASLICSRGSHADFAASWLFSVLNTFRK